MDITDILRTLAALSAVLALLGAGLWMARRFGVVGGGSAGHGRVARLALAERIALDQKRSIALVRHGTAEHLILLAPEGNILLGDQREEIGEPMVIDLVACRALATTVPLPPAPSQPLLPALPAIRHRPTRIPRPDPFPARCA
ncbi:flagellar biosynthetic protein FliO [Sphingobium fluviale]|uniref:Flagellar biogenesis protein n=1 Tax=Sphingobium fluviale TaxID=2506423 RepID=A0A4Q1KFZ7_9SPHN|nr:flagellar biosynthetic protein FliO [Sphingobium fluviale]RXR28372.1 hypothetical protein EQG66_09980 [Sphingobium fluviale]